MEEFVLAVCNKDIKKLSKVGQDIIEYLKNNSTQVENPQLPFLIDGLIPWLSNSNFKINLNGLEILRILAEQNKKQFHPFINSILAAVLDKLGDQRDQVRDSARTLIYTLIEDLSNPQVVFEKLSLAFTHKQWHAREQTLIIFQYILNKYGPSSITTSKYVPSIAKLLSDQNSQVRDQAHVTLVLIYTHIGEKFKLDLKRKNIIPATKFNSMLEEFEEIRRTGKLLARDEDTNSDIASSTSCTTSNLESNNPNFKKLIGQDQPDNAYPHLAATSNLGKGDLLNGLSDSHGYTGNHDKYNNGNNLYEGTQTIHESKISSKPTPPPNNHKSSVNTQRSVSVTRSKKIQSSHLASMGRLNVHATSGAAPSHANPSSSGAMDEESFYEAFEDVPKIIISSGTELEDVMTKIRDLLSTDKTDWNKRNEEMRKIRSIVLCGINKQYPDIFYSNLKLLDPSFQLAIKDLRSQIVRETCVTLAFLIQTFGTRFEHTLESLLPHILPLISNTVKIMSSSSIILIKFIIKHVHSPKLIPIFVQLLSSKSRDIRKNLYEFLDYIVHNWDTCVLEKYCTLLQDAIKKGLQDADSDARAASRKAYWGFADHFKDQADELIHSLDAGKQRMLRGEISNSSSNNSLATGATSSTLGSVAGRHLANRFAKTPSRLLGKTGPAVKGSSIALLNHGNMNSIGGRTPYKRPYNGATSLEDIAKHGRQNIPNTFKSNACGGSNLGLSSNIASAKSNNNNRSFFFVVDGDVEHGLTDNPNEAIEQTLIYNDGKPPVVYKYSGGSSQGAPSTLTGGDSTITSMETNYCQRSIKYHAHPSLDSYAKSRVRDCKLIDTTYQNGHENELPYKRSTSAIDALAVVRARKRSVGFPSKSSAASVVGVGVKARVDTNIHGRRVIGKAMSTYGGSNTRLNHMQPASYHLGINHNRLYEQPPTNNSSNHHHYRPSKTSSSISQPGSRSTSPSLNVRNNSKYNLFSSSIHHSYRIPPPPAPPLTSNNNNSNNSNLSVASRFHQNPVNNNSSSTTNSSSFKSHTIGRNNLLYQQFATQSNRGSFKLNPKNNSGSRTLINKFSNPLNDKNSQLNNYQYNPNNHKSDEDEDAMSEHSSSFCSEHSFQHYATRFTSNNNNNNTNYHLRGRPGAGPYCNDATITGTPYYNNTLGTHMQAHVHSGSISNESSTRDSYSPQRSLSNLKIKESNEIISLLASMDWADRKEGLIHILRFFRSGRQLKSKEVKPVMENFSKMFMDPHSKVFSIFLDALIEFVSLYHDHLQDWLYVLLTKLLTKMGQELLTSINTKCQKLLELIKNLFAPSLQFDYICKFLTDQTMTPNFKVKLAILNHMLNIIPYLKVTDFYATNDLLEDNTDFTNSPCQDTQYSTNPYQLRAMSKIVSLTSEPKNNDVRKISIQILLALFNLNPATFTMNLQTMPQHQQDTVSEILKYHRYQLEVTTGNNQLSGSTSPPPPRELLDSSNNLLLLQFSQETPTKHNNSRKFDGVGRQIDHYSPHSHGHVDRRESPYTSSKSKRLFDDNALNNLDSAMNRLNIKNETCKAISSRPSESMNNDNNNNKKSNYVYTPHVRKQQHLETGSIHDLLGNTPSDISPNLIMFSPAPRLLANHQTSNNKIGNGFSGHLTVSHNSMPNGISNGTTLKPFVPPKPRLLTTTNSTSNPNYTETPVHLNNDTITNKVNTLQASQSSPLGFYTPPSGVKVSCNFSNSRIPSLSSSTGVKRVNSFSSPQGTLGNRAIINDTITTTTPNSAQRNTHNPVILVVNGRGHYGNNNNNNKNNSGYLNDTSQNDSNLSTPPLSTSSSFQDNSFEQHCNTITPPTAHKYSTNSAAQQLKNREPFDMTCISSNTIDEINGTSENAEQLLKSKLAKALSENSSESDITQCLAYLKYLAVNPMEFANMPATTWDKQFNQIILPFLLKQLSHEKNQIKCNTLSTLRELMKADWQPFLPYTELTLMKLIHTMRDSSKEVSRLAEECSFVFIKNIPTSTTGKLINSLVNNSPFPTNLHAIKILNQMADHYRVEDLNSCLIESVNALIQCCEHEESMVRKSAVYCLVSFHSKFGNSILPLFDPLSTQKRKILQLYIDRASTTNNSASIK